MSTEINTRGSIREKISVFPSGNDAECLSKAEIISKGNGSVYIFGDYKDSECPKLSDIESRAGTYRGMLKILSSVASDIPVTTDVTVVEDDDILTLTAPGINIDWIDLGTLVITMTKQGGLLMHNINFVGGEVALEAITDVDVFLSRGDCSFSIVVSWLFTPITINFTGTKI